MRLNEEIVVAEFDGGRIILVVDNPHKINGELYARDLYGNFDYLVIASPANKFSQERYSLSTAYFEVAKTGRLMPLYLDSELIGKYNLKYGDEVDDSLLIELEDEMAIMDGNKIDNSKPFRR